MNNKIVYIVHAVDSEGPLSESLEATFDRLDKIFGVKLTPSKANLKKIQEGKLDFGSKSKLIAEVFSPHLITYHDSWEKIERMLETVSSESFRKKIPDSFGNGWIYNWFCLDHVDYQTNPRRRDMGYHKIHDFYLQKLHAPQYRGDAIHWHFHPMSIYHEANRSGTSFVNSTHLYECLCRRIIERNYFPAAFRSGSYIIRPDSNYFLEQWIPFDLSNWSHTSSDDDELQNDISAGRLGDWRLAPDDWSVYHPSYDNWQIPGSMKRWIARSLSINTRGKGINEFEIDKAFQRADGGQPTLMSICNHDFRDVGYEVDYVRSLLQKVSINYPDVKFKYCEAIEAFREVIGEPDPSCMPVELDVSLTGNSEKRVLQVNTLNGAVFGPQPFLAVQTKSDRFIHENFIFDPSLTSWSYIFDDETIRADDIYAIGVAANDKLGNTFIKVIHI